MDLLNVSVVLPLYKPKGNWQLAFTANVKELNEVMSPNVSIEYIVVNDGTDDTDIRDFFSGLQTQYNVRYISYEENQGKGFAQRAGVALASSPYVILTDFDFPYVTENIVAMVQELKKGNEIVIGRRDKRYFRNLPFSRRVISEAYMFLCRLCFHSSLIDVQSGIKGFNQTGKAVFLKTEVNRFLVDTEFVLRALHEDLSMENINITLKPGIHFSNFGSGTIFTELKNFFSLIKLNRSLKRGDRMLNERVAQA
ncbi:MAG: glycosyltransferase family 2 protein [Niabella sp.]|nr:glycosyltransferase family 2 protein [Niabella sp.]